MAKIRFMSKVEQVAAHLQAELASGRWGEKMPGRLELAEELEINSKTVEAALKQLEKAGLLVPQGAGRRRRIAAPGSLKPQAMRVNILHYERADREQPHQIELFHHLLETGHTAVVAEKSLQELGMNVERISRFVKNNAADAWIVSSGSREVLEWFAAQPFPSFAVFGRFSELPIAGTGVRKIPAMRLAVQKMVELGHRRIVMLTHKERRKPIPALFEQTFLDQLAAHGITSGAYNLPEWDNSRKDFHRCLDSLFKMTPPTALIIQEVSPFIAAQQYLALRGLVAPRDISLFCDDPCPAFDWCNPVISHIHWDAQPVVRQVMRWISNVSRGRKDLRQSYNIADFIEGGTIGPVSVKR